MSSSLGCGCALAVIALVAMANTDPAFGSPASLETGLAAWYPFDGHAYDLSGNGNHGMVSGATLTADRLGNPASAYSFDGDDYIRIPDSPSLNRTSDLTISAWINTLETISIIFSNMRETSPHDGYSFRFTVDGRLYFLSGDKPAFGNSMVTTGAWTHVAVTLAGTQANFYVNGVSNGSAVVGVPTSFSGDQTIGSSYTPSYFFNGSMDDVRVYSRALSASEVAELAVPEPSSMILVAVAGGALKLARKRRV